MLVFGLLAVYADNDSASFVFAAAVGVNSGKKRKAASRGSIEENGCEGYIKMLDLMPIGISIIDRGGLIKYANAAQERLLGAAKGRLLGKKVWDFITPISKRSSMRKYFMKLLEEQPEPETFTTQNTTIDGRVIEVEINWNYIPDDKGGVASLLSTTRDITFRKRAEESLALLKKAVDTIKVGITITNTKGKIIYTNPAEAEMHGYALEDLFGQDARILAPRQLWDEKHRRNILRMSNWSRESLNLRKDGSSFPVRLVSVVVMDDNGKPLGIITVCEDITERKRLEERLRDATMTDDLTGLLNRRGFLAMAGKALAVARREGEDVSMLFADLDNLKWINDTLGHGAGDACLIEGAEVLRKTFRESDIIGRVGGDEFAVLVTGIEREEQKMVLGRLEENISEVNSEKGRAYNLSLSSGIVRYDASKYGSLGELMSKADNLMYESKKKKKSRKEGVYRAIA